MAVLYRPHRGNLADAMKEVKEFSSIKEMCGYLVQYYQRAFDTSEVYISYYCYDERVGWETFIVKVARHYDEKYGCPQAIGFCTLKGGEEK